MLIYLVAETMTKAKSGFDHPFGHKQQRQRIIRHTSVANNPLSLLAQTMTKAARSQKSPLRGVGPGCNNELFCAYYELDL
ncbi:MAG: hypothetical protein ACPGWR_06240 [Ardenticatenaceae bacterium]